MIPTYKTCECDQTKNENRKMDGTENEDREVIGTHITFQFHKTPTRKSGNFSKHSSAGTDSKSTTLKLSLTCESWQHSESRGSHSACHDVRHSTYHVLSLE